jgi:DNA-binding CsgD family transcriptional regulator
MSDSEKLRQLYDIVGDCWVWRGRTDKSKSPNFRGHNARRFAYEEKHGPLIGHTRFTPSCGNDRCINPDHMEVKSRLADDLIAEIVDSAKGLSKREATKAMYAAGMNLQQIGDTLGFSRELARQLIHNVSVPRDRKKREMEERTTKIMLLIHIGKDVADIATALNLKKGTVRHTIKTYLQSATRKIGIEYLESLKKRREELQAQLEDFTPIMEELRKVNRALALLEGGANRPKSLPEADA